VFARFGICNGSIVMDETQVEEIELSMQYILQNHPARVEYQTSEEFDQMIDVQVESAPIEAGF
jgi:hypothetical protein